MHYAFDKNNSNCYFNHMGNRNATEYSGNEIPLVNLHALRMWDEHFNFCIFKVRHTAENMPFRYRRNFWKIVLVLSGHAFQCIDGVNYPIHPNSLFIIHPENITSYQISDNEEIEVCNIVFSSKLLDAIMPFLSKNEEFMRIFQVRSGTPVPFVPLLYFQQADRQMIRLVQAMLREYTRGLSNFESQLQLLLAQLLNLLARAAERRSRNDRNILLAEKISRYLQEHYQEKIDFSAFATATGISRQHLYRVFFDHYGTSPGQALRRYRLQIAKYLLLEKPTQSIAEICFSCGFSDLSFFYRVFRREFGIPPGAVRK